MIIRRVKVRKFSKSAASGPLRPQWFSCQVSQSYGALETLCWWPTGGFWQCTFFFTSFSFSIWGNNMSTLIGDIHGTVKWSHTSAGECTCRHGCTHSHLWPHISSSGCINAGSSAAPLYHYVHLFRLFCISLIITWNWSSFWSIWFCSEHQTIDTVQNPSNMKSSTPESELVLCLCAK